MPSRAARWISAITPRSKVADSRIVDRERVQRPGGPVAAELGGIGVADAGALEQRAQLGRVLRVQLLLDAVGAERRDAPAHVQARLVDRVAERLAGVAADDERARLGHEGAHVAR